MSVLFSSCPRPFSLCCGRLILPSGYSRRQVFFVALAVKVRGIHSVLSGLLATVAAVESVFDRREGTAAGCPLG
jgi:hypothetical protein